MIFFGTPDFAVPTLRHLCEHGRRPILVVTQPARPRGRGRHLQQPPVADWATNQGLDLTQPQDVRDPDFLERLGLLQPTTAVVVAFGQIFPRTLLDLPARGCINVHASLLPRHRGAAPIQAAIIAGDEVTGITTMLMDEGLDTGPILLQEELEIGSEETAGELAERLSIAGARLLIETLEARDQDRLDARPQPADGASLARRLRRSDGTIDWRVPSQNLFNLLRGLTPWPGVSTTLRAQPLKIVWGRPVAASAETAEEPGTYLGVRDERLLVSCGHGTVFGVERVQRPGRKTVPATAFVNGERLEAGERLG